jgi:hypothetical protein
MSFANEMNRDELELKGVLAVMAVYVVAAATLLSTLL